MLPVELAPPPWANAGATARPSTVTSAHTTLVQRVIENLLTERSRWREGGATE
jgi:hypothetical protein